MKTLVACLVILSAMPVHADGKEALARKRFDSGQRLSARGQYSEALAEFSVGFELSGKPLFLFNMAECARSAGQKDRARQLYQRYLSSDPLGKLAHVAQTRLEELAAAPAPAAPPAAAPPAPPAAPPPRPSPPPAPALAVTMPAPAAMSRAPRRPVWKSKALWIGVGVGAAAIIVAGAVGGYYGSRGGIDGCTGACVSFR